MSKQDPYQIGIYSGIDAHGLVAQIQLASGSHVAIEKSQIAAIAVTEYNTTAQSPIGTVDFNS